MLGTRGIPANHGGFEACVENLAPFLAEKNLDVFVFCQLEKERDSYETYKGVNLVDIVVKNTGSLGTVIFDVKSIVHAIFKFNNKDLIVFFGYPTAFLFPILKVFGFKNIVNMDGVEWKRRQFGLSGKLWYWINEKIAVLTADALIGDHPKIVKHLEKINFMNRPLYSIAYSADDNRGANISEDYIDSELENIINGQEFALVIARLEPDNQILEIVRAFSREKRDFILCVAGRFDPEGYKYHRDVLAAASSQVFFLGGVYGKNEKIFLRNRAACYLHGHTVGGTNPSLVEGLGSTSPIIAHNNEFNRGVAKDGAVYFSGENDLREIFQNFPRNALLLSRKKADAVFIDFKHEAINTQYLRLIQTFVS